MNITVGYDGSNSSKRALDVALEHAKAFHAKINIVTSHEETIDTQAMKDEMEKIKEKYKAAQIECETHTLTHGGSPGEDLIKFAAEKNTFEIIMGVKKRSKLGKLIFGSNIQFVILEAPCPVLTVK